MPNEINIQISNVCNLQCRFCARNWTSIKERQPFIDPLDFFDIVEICVDNGIDTFCLTPTMGEVFLHPNIFDLLNYLEWNEYVKRFFFSTNFTVANEETIKEVIKYEKLGLQISVYGFDYQSFQKNTNRNMFAKFENNVETLFLSLSKKACSLEFCIRFPFETLPRNRIGLLLQVMKETYNVKINESEQLNFNLGGLIDYKDLDTMYGPHEKKGVCPTAKMGCIYENGDFGLCYMNDIHRKHILGNVFKKSMKSMYKKIDKITKRQAKGKYNGICKSCDERWEIYSTSSSSRK